MSARRFASGTRVPIERSAAEVERVLRKYGAEQFARGWRKDEAVLSFVMRERHVRFVLPLPPRSAFDVDGMKGKVRTEIQGNDAHAQEHRRLWRALALIVKAKLEAVDSGVVAFEIEFLPHFMLASGGTVGDEIAPQVQRALSGGPAPRLLGGS